MTTSNIFVKDPHAVLDYKWDFKPLTHGVAGATSDYLANGETVVTATVTPQAGLTVDSYSITDTGTSVTAWFSTSTADNEYTAVCHFTTSAGRTDDRSIIVAVRNL
jgi:hypothetical protein